MIANRGILLRDGQWLSDGDSRKYITDSILTKEAADYKSERRKQQLYVYGHYAGYAVIVALAILLPATRVSPLGPTLIAGLVLAALLSVSLYLFRRKLVNFTPVFEVREVRRIAFPLGIVDVSGKRALVDTSGYTPATTFSFPYFQEPDQLFRMKKLVVECRKQLDKPILKPSDRTSVSGDSATEVFSYDSESRILADLAELRRLLASMKHLQIEAPLAPADGPVLQFVRNNCEQTSPESDAAVIPVRAPSELTAQLVWVRGVYEAEQKADDGKDIIQGLNQVVSECNATCRQRSTSFEKSLTAFCDFRTQMGMHTLHSALVMFCPRCNEDFFGRKDYTNYSFNTNSKMTFDYNRKHWTCPMCGEPSTSPIPVPRIYVELIFPLASSLLMENRVERLKLYKDAGDQKREYVEEFEREVREILRHADEVIDELGAKTNTLRAELVAEKETIGAMTAIMAVSMERHSNRMHRISQTSEEMVSLIEKTAGAMVRDFRGEMGEIVEQASGEFRQHMEAARIAEEKRDKQWQTLSQNVQEVGKQVAEGNKTMSAMEQHQRTIAQTQLAEAEEKGHTKKSLLFHPVYNTQKALNNAATWVTGGSTMDATKKNLALEQ